MPQIRTQELWLTIDQHKIRTFCFNVNWTEMYFLTSCSMTSPDGRDIQAKVDWSDVDLYRRIYYLIPIGIVLFAVRSSLARRKFYLPEF
jgi:hypothetical protein